MTISILIVSYNVSALLKNCILTILPQLEANDEIIVVDNASVDGSADMIKNQFPTVKLINAQKNIGFSGGNNLALNSIKGDFTLLLNPDTELLENSLEKLRASLKINGDTHILGAHLLNTDGSFQNSGWNISNGFHMLAEALSLQSLFHNRLSSKGWTKNREVKALSGAAMALCTKTLMNLKGFDPLLFWMEDVDLCYRCSMLGFSPLWVYDWKIYHHSGKSSSSSNGIPLANQLISRLKFYKKYKWSLSLVIGHIACIIQLSSRLTLLLLISPFSEKAKNRSKAYRFAFRKYFRFLFLNDKSIL